jgi:dTDP-glucose 4,6-dehydratase
VKIIPKFITNLLEGKRVPLHGDGGNIRTYMYVEDVCDAIHLIFEKGAAGEIYNIGTKDEISNLELTRTILKEMGKDEKMIEFVPDRPFNDRRYSIDISRLAKLGWRQRTPFPEGIRNTIKWYKDHPDWWRPLKSRVRLD